MRINTSLLTIVAGLFCISGMTYAQQTHLGVTKTIKITVNISDSIFVSRPDGGGWYNTVNLAATDGTQKSFAADLPVQVWTSTPGVNVTLVHPLDLTRTDAAYKMEKVNVKFGDGGNSGKDLNAGNVSQTFAQNMKVGNGYQSVYHLQIKANSPTTADRAATQGYYTGDLVMLFEIPTSAI
ncbi:MULTISPECIES: CS1 type fimbrial major subunit [unclassified Serratia (in: enterobacteria)]|uniref:CS1 type fimbrial major subunit n=1 Tax=unclassified Serratia (in: enterobacteria) TaxID=2647522 RepID=UPI0009DEAC68|nr:MULTISPECIES: CS1 type fimbrial major subunit [unclassified Serratia (in: enterobacteria)]